MSEPTAAAATTSSPIVSADSEVGVQVTNTGTEVTPMSSTQKSNDSGDDECDYVVTTVPNMTTAEQVMINRLVGQNPETRKFVLQKLEDWLRAIHSWFPNYIQVERESQIVIHVEGNFVRVWKALFCSIWLAADKKHSLKGLLVEPITDYLIIISDDPILLSLFVEQFFITLIREWTWIDTQRLEFMTLIRLLLRKLLQEYSKYNWKKEYLESFISTLNVCIFNHHSPPPRATRANAKTSPPLQAPSDFQIHVVRIFLEELEMKLNNVSREESSQILKLVSPFVNELAESEDAELVNEIKLGIELHLLKSPTIDNVDLLGSTLETVGLNDKCNKTAILFVGAEILEPMQCEENSDSKGPRSQQLNLDYGDLVLTLFRAAAQKNTKTSNRTLVIALAEKFQALEVPDPKPETTKLLAAEDEPVLIPSKPHPLDLDKMKKYIKIKKLLRDLPKAREETVNVTHTNSTYLNDPELIDHIGDNYMSYLVEMEQNALLSPRRAQGSKSDSRDASSTCTMYTENTNRKLNFETCILNRNKEGEEITENGTIENKTHSENETKTEDLINTRKRRISDTENSSSPSRSVVFLDDTNNLHDQEDIVVTPNKRSKLVKYKLEPETSSASSSTSSPKICFVSSPSSPTNNPVVMSPFTPSPFRKGVLFVLAKNLEHEHSDYEDLIARSPVIPFDGNKRPTSSGLLKTKLTRKTSFWKKRKVAAYQKEVLEITTTEPTALN